MAFDDIIDIVDRTAKSLLGGELIVVDATLTKVASGTRVPDAQSAGTNPTSQAHACRAWVAPFVNGTTTQINGTLIKTEDRVITILVSSLTAGVVPMPGDKITIEDPPDSGVSVTFRIVGGSDGLGVKRDPASFNFACHGRK